MLCISCGGVRSVLDTVSTSAAATAANVLDGSIPPPGGGVQVPAAADARPSLRIYAYLTDAEETNVARNRAGVGGRAGPLSEWMFVPRDHRQHREHRGQEQWALPPGESRFTPPLAHDSR